MSYQAQSPAVGLVLPSNSPGVHTLWLPVIPMQIGLVLKPARKNRGRRIAWRPRSSRRAFRQKRSRFIPGGGDVGAAVLANCDRSMIFGGTPTVERYKGNPKVQAHGPGFSKILLGDDVVDEWEKYIDLMADSIYLNSGRGCINCSGVWASRHTKEIAEALAKRIGPVASRCRRRIPKPALAAFTIPGAAPAVWKSIEAELKEDGVEHMTAQYGPRLVEMERCAYLRPSDRALQVARDRDREGGIHVPVRQGGRMPAGKNAGVDWSDAGVHGDHGERGVPAALTDAMHIDGLNIGPIPTIKLDWLQPHEGNIVEFLFRARAYQLPQERLAELRAKR